MNDYWTEDEFMEVWDHAAQRGKMAFTDGLYIPAEVELWWAYDTVAVVMDGKRVAGIWAHFPVSSI